MSDEERTAQDAAAEFMRTVAVQDVVVSMVQTVFDVGYRRTGLAGGEGERDLEQTRVAIETVRALLPVLEGMMDASSVTALRGALAELQLAYARELETGGAQSPRPPGPEQEPPAGPPQAADRPAQEPRAAPTRPKIWTPGGER